jgi:hypothetical protein
VLLLQKRHPFVRQIVRQVVVVAGLVLQPLRQLHVICDVVYQPRVRVLLLLMPTHEWS